MEVWAGERCHVAQWPVGCDGECSTVRKEAGIELLGTEAKFTWYPTVCDLDRPELLKQGSQYIKSGMYVTVGPGHLYAVDLDVGFDRSHPNTQEHVQDVLQRFSGKDITIKALHLASSFTDRSKSAALYRKGRILLAGDRTRIHLPLGAQGLNTGIGNAIYLGWKLAATVKSFASPGLLDTCH